MAAKTETGRIDSVWGNRRVVEGDIATITDGDTWAPGLALVQQVIITPTTATAGQSVAATFSGGTITLVVESGTPSARVTAIGF